MSHVNQRKLILLDEDLKKLKSSDFGCVQKQIGTLSKRGWVLAHFVMINCIIIITNFHSMNDGMGWSM